MAITGEVAARALTDTWRDLVAATPDGWTRREGGAIAAVTMVPVATLNVVFADGPDANLEAVTALLDEVAATGLPHCLLARPGSEPVLGPLAQQRGMSEDTGLPLMVLEDPGALGDGEHAEMTIRALVPEEAQVHVHLAALGFEAPEEYFRRLMTTDVLTAPGVRCYVGEVDRELVTTGCGVTSDDFVGIFNIATPPEHRRHGYGAAVTSRAVRDGLRAGASWAWLQASSAGYPIYERLGFRTVESWCCWVMPQ